MKNWKKKLTGLLIFLAPSLFLGAIVGAYPGYKAYEYVWKDAGFCITCHVHDYATVGWKKSIHGQTTTCHDCHHQPLKAYLVETYIMLKDRPKFPKDLHHTPYVKKGLCEACHVTHPHDITSITGPMAEAEIEKIPKVDTSYLHKVHLEKRTNYSLLNLHELTEEERLDPKPPKLLPADRDRERPIVCADCHGGPTNRGHNFGAVDISCVRCHTTAHGSKVLKEQGCRTCHFQDFLAPVPGHK